ncbi:Dipeptidyl aminopeptidase/acylaminoacyl peptidase [Filimonas lacunae]|uniref:Dipeptidyl aminopeptidase/acylaminoacyl peptidase n=1 Tax=Filimonas lacunae TaxID=477680 RepID=A0A173MQE1_9BACT|nr:prolyl oligopeptidase family serine peptidase [Filimonas lacunae]BAV09670.1 dipeptidyl peptidase IV [Filimonas lacunae]SIS76912.1 Dipeptidyl aminopeptidase/acylaminoacyl peptidase [Filimonas lacunae]
MRKLLAGGLLLCCWQHGLAQNLTVEKIMRDPKWIGSSPSNIVWSYNSKNFYFDWNPQAQTSDSSYRSSISGSAPEKAGYRQAQLAVAISRGSYNHARTHIVYTLAGDIYLLEIKTGNTTRVTHTEEVEANPSFFKADAYISYVRNQNLFAWNIKTGSTEQLTNFIKGGEAIAPPAPAAGRGRGGDRGAAANAGNNAAAKTTGNRQEQWLQQDELRLMDIVRERKEKKEAREAFLQTVKETDTLVNINIGDKTVANVQVSPDGRFISYRLFQAASGTKNTIVPNYVTESSFTTDIPARTKVGVAQGKYELFVLDTQKDSVIAIKTDSIPGITDLPDYTKDYPNAISKTPAARPVFINGPWWNEQGTAAIVDIRSQDNKDRWIMLLDAASGTLTLADRQRDEAWIGGPGIGYNANIDWINSNTFYFQSEATGYAHLYTYNITTHQKKALTQGNYEIQEVALNTAKTHFYLLTNEVHPGKQHWYRIKTDGSDKQQITSMEGGYEIELSPDEKYIAYRYSYINKPWELYVQENAPGKKPVQITNKAASDSFKTYPWRETKIFTIPARDGKNIYARIYEPATGRKNGSAVIFVHGAGYLQNVHYWWSSYFREYMFNNLLADKGYTVLDIDYRASSGYGRDWRTGIYRHMGGKDLDDEVDAANYLVKELGINPSKIGMYGGSYGGFMTLMALFTQPDVFKAGAALRPVTDWAHYNHGYTSNILNEPFTDSLAYYRSSPINFAAGLKNNLLICHGMVDVNVHFQDAVRLNQRLIELGKDNWQMAVYPMEDHGFVEPGSWTDEYKRILKLFDTTLLP